MKITKCGPLAPRAELFLLALIASIAASAPAEDWPQFRGENSSGVSKSDKPLPTKFSLTENLRWSAKIGDGICSPIVVGGKVFSTAMTGEQKLGVFAFDAATGKQLWKTEVETGKLPR